MSKKRAAVVCPGPLEAAGPRPEVGRLLESSQADDRRVIQLVRERPLLYARNNMPVASFYNSVKRLWQEVARLMGWSVAEVRRKWSHIRNSYSRHLRNEVCGARTGRGRAVSRWYLADELEFLRDHMATDTRCASYKQPFLPSMVQTSLTELSPGGAAGAEGGAWGCGGWLPPKLEPPEPPADDSCPSPPPDADDDSSYFQFFRGIYNDYQELPPRKQRLFRRQCINLLHDLLDEHDAPPAPPAAPPPAPPAAAINLSAGAGGGGGAHTIIIAKVDSGTDM